MSYSMSLISCTVCGTCCHVRQCTCGQVSYCSKVCQLQDWMSHKQDCPLVMVREMEGRGKGLVATRRIPAGTAIFTEDPLVVVKKATMVPKDEFKKFQKMNEKSREDFLSLFDPVGMELNKEWRRKWNLSGMEEPDLVKFWRIICANAVVIGLVRSDVPRSCNDLNGVYKQFSRINHSCSSNIIQDWKEETPLKIEVRAAAAIQKGVELTLNYLGLLGTWEERRQQLERKWYFQCLCEVCSLPAQERNNNDMVREFITYQMELASSVQGLASLSNVSSVLNDYLKVLCCCYSIEKEAKDILPVVLSICHKLYQAVVVNRVSWECPTELKGNLVDKLGHTFMEILDKEAVAKAEVLGSEMVKMVSDNASD
eukprot:GFUD01020309.1.p1 GENE.GFUD01020309.1~~GFUD01020309.1.p1  ORF type:complete len:369 (+),score=108.34 GFUD01020309.1:88-1194(+)